MKRISVTIIPLLFWSGILFLPAQAAEYNWITLDHPNAISTYALDHSGGNIVGYCEDKNGKYGFQYNGANWTTLNFPEAIATTPYGIDGGNIVGDFAFDYFGQTFYNAFFYNGATWTPLVYPGGGEVTYTSASGLDGDNIVGMYSTFKEEWEAAAYVYNISAGTWTPFASPYGSFTFENYTQPYGIHGDHVVGNYFSVIDNAYHGFLYNFITTDWITIDHPDGYLCSPTGIAGANIVGHYEAEDQADHGFLFDGTEWTTIDYPGAAETRILDIDGATLVGYYIDDEGMTHGFFATPVPVPSAVFLLGSGLAGLVGWIRRKGTGG